MAAETRTKLLNAAETLFYEHGFHATGIDRIIAAAGVVRMTLYNHFRSKDALIQAVLDQRHARFMASLDAALATAQRGQAVNALIEAYERWLQTHSPRGCILVQAMREFAHSSDAIWQQAQAAKNDLRARLSQALAINGLTSETTADRLFIILEGATAAMPVLGEAAVHRQTHAQVAALLGDTRPAAG